MLSVYQLKPAFQKLLRPAVGVLANVGVTANGVTLSAAALSVVYAVALLCVPDSRLLWLGLPVLLFIRMALNAVDGMLAREWNQKSRLGAFLNELCDIFSDTALFLPLLALNGVSSIAVAALIGASALSEVAGLISQATGGARRYDGPFGKSDRALVLGAIALAVALNIPLASIISPVLWVLTALALYTMVNRVRAALSEGGS